MNSALKLIHTSDCHLGSDAGWREESAFEAAIDLAIGQSVDLVLVAGDLFDSTRPDPATIEWAIRQLARMTCPVVLIPGNHDAHERDAVFGEIIAAASGSNIFALSEEAGSSIELTDIGATVWGRALTTHSPVFRPLEGLPTRSADCWNLVMGHGFVQSSNIPNGRSAPIFPRELRDADCDYIALGHCHTYRDVSAGGPPAFYCGATADSHAGQPGVIVADLVGGRTAAVQWVALA